MTPIRPSVVAQAEPTPQDIAEAAGIVLAPTEDYPRIDLRAVGEPWGRRRAAGKVLRAAVAHAEHASWSPPKNRPARKRNDGRLVLEVESKGNAPSVITASLCESKNYLRNSISKVIKTAVTIGALAVSSDPAEAQLFRAHLKHRRSVETKRLL